RLVDQEPDRADYLRDLSVSFNKLGDLMRALGQGAEARRYYEQALAIRQRLVDQEPDRADYLRDLSVSFERMGDMHQESSPGEARRFYRLSLSNWERLCQTDPENVDFQTGIVIPLVRLGDRDSLQRAFDILFRLVSANRLSPDKQQWLPAVAGALLKVNPSWRPPQFGATGGAP
ncbi:MAG: tetratricopeptide repeat protein, partial [Acidobacteria bacterium]|nr:tetratricopeptide repeat protein [Acidobacteriota bacterium]